MTDDRSDARVPGESAGEATEEAGPGLQAQLRTARTEFEQPLQDRLTEGSALVRIGPGAELVEHEPGGGGAVFSVGSICWPASILVDDGVAQITENVIRRYTAD